MDFVVILNYHGREDTLACVESIVTGDPHMQVLVVDNGSRDGALQEVTARWGHVSTLQTGDNLGFAGGMNAGIRWCLDAGAKTITVLNNDTVVPPGTLARLAAQVTDGLVVSPEVRYADGSEKVWFGGGTIDRATSLARHLSDAELARIDGTNTPALRKTQVLAGCCVTATAHVWTTVGLFDEAFFLNFEDSDWSVRARRMGVQLAVVTGEHIYHKVSASFTGAYSYLGLFYYTRNGLLFGTRSGVTGRLAPLRFLRRHVVPMLKGDVRARDWQRAARRGNVIVVAVCAHLLKRYGRAPRWLERQAGRWPSASGR